MTRTNLFAPAAAVLLASTALVAQTPLAFEVASIHPVGPILPTANQQISAGVHVDGQHFQASFLALRDYIAMAYKAKVTQIDAPDWTKSERYDISATMPVLPEGQRVNEDNFAEMVRLLLEDRFALKTHRETRDYPIYALVQEKGGIKAKEDPLDPLTREGVTVGGTGGAQGTAIALGRGATLAVGGNKIEARKITMQALAETLARFVDRPVADQTGLDSAYDITLEITPQDFQALMIRAGQQAGVPIPPEALKLLDTASGDSLHEALAMVGLKLQATKAPLEFLVVDSVNRTPTEN